MCNVILLMRRKMGYALRLCHERVKEIAWLYKDGNKKMDITA